MVGVRPNRRDFVKGVGAGTATLGVCPLASASTDTAGWIGYSYANPSDSVLTGEETPAEGRRALETALTESDPTGDGAPLFADPADVPGMPWKETEGHLSGVVTDEDGGPLDGVTIRARRRGEVVTEAVTTGNGWFGVVDLDPGRYHVEVAPGEVAGERVQKVRVRPGELATAEFEVVETVASGEGN